MAFDATLPAERRALVTGATGGIGWAICRRLAAQGCRVALADLDEAAASEHAAALGPNHVWLAADLTVPGAAALLPARAAQALSGLDVVVNNAGMTDSSGRSLIDMPEEIFVRQAALNLTAVERICEASAALLSEGGRIVNLASGAAYRPLALRGPYSATKAGLVALTEALAKTLAPRAIAVSAVAPGYTRTPLVEALQKQGRVDLEAVARGIPLGRIALPDDIAAGVAFCAGPDGATLSGKTLLIDGGGSAGAAPQGAAPEAGRGDAGCLVILGPLDVANASVEAGDSARLADYAAISAVIDSRALEGEITASQRLCEARAAALGCAAHPGRARDFSLLFVSRPGGTPGARAAAAAQDMFARTLALEWAPAGIRVNSVLWHQDSMEGLGALCRFLTGPDAAFITGQTIMAG
jgi:NAD(P)-dependent dehydrogenase (short-subunit alcohol dehydrogenase family)